MNFTDLLNNDIVIAGVVLLVLFAIFEIIYINRKRANQYKLAVQRRSKILSTAEKSFFECLVNALSDEFYVFAKVGILDVVEASPSAGNLEKRRINRVLRGDSLDYVLCKKHDLSIFGVVELENFDKRGDQKSKEARELLVSEVCKLAHLRLFYFDIRQDYRDVDIKRLVTGRSGRKPKDANANAAGSPTHLTVDHSAYEVYAKQRTCPQCNGEVVTKVAVKGKNIGEKYLLCRKYPYCDYRTHVEDSNLLKLQEQQAKDVATRPGYKDWSAG